MLTQPIGSKTETSGSTSGIPDAHLTMAMLDTLPVAIGAEEKIDSPPPDHVLAVESIHESADATRRIMARRRK